LVIAVCWLCTSGFSGAQEPRSGPPPDLLGGMFQRPIERMWRDPPAFKEHCDRLGARARGSAADESAGALRQRPSAGSARGGAVIGALER
jgi:hypothetical protein